MKIYIALEFSALEESSFTIIGVYSALNKAKNACLDYYYEYEKAKIKDQMSFNKDDFFTSMFVWKQETDSISLTIEEFLDGSPAFGYEIVEEELDNNVI